MYMYNTFFKCFSMGECIFSEVRFRQIFNYGNIFIQGNEDETLVITVSKDFSADDLSFPPSFAG